MRGTIPPPITKPQPFSVGVFSCLIAPVPAYSCGFLRTPADFASQTNSPFRATFHSLLAIPRSDLAPWNWPEVRKGRNAGPYRSTTYARTNQAVGLQHWMPEWAGVPRAKPADLPCVLFDLFKQFLRSEPGSGVLRRGKRFKLMMAVSVSSASFFMGAPPLEHHPIHSLCYARPHPISAGHPAQADR